MTAREIVNNYNFSEGDLDWKTKSAFHKPLDFIGGARQYPRTEEDNTSKNVHPGWSGHLGELIKKQGFVEDPNDPIHVVEDHPDSGPTILDGQHRVAAMFALHPDQKIPVFKSNYAWVVSNKEQLRTAEANRKKRAEINYQLEQGNE
ncbi:hypothetical protein UFOVP45_142 [uncultured Caudovirales phage]|uniref:ParB/Sulfiredoxin n=1 Tax=uncultured Caudovirales phage TaxID=2100421 RepID=A0A6J5KQ98_9CAUD|nr:hypothetical protein UFOVP45_142 [uncultured Caudovirales phage]